MQHYMTVHEFDDLSAEWRVPATAGNTGCGHKPACFHQSACAPKTVPSGLHSGLEGKHAAGTLPLAQISFLGCLLSMSKNLPASVSATSICCCTYVCCMLCLLSWALIEGQQIKFCLCIVLFMQQESAGIHRVPYARTFCCLM